VPNYGWNTTAYQILNPGISHWFSAAHDAVVGFVQHCGVRNVAGAPACAKERLMDEVTEFEQSSARANCRKQFQWCD
jgi:phosphatidylglycerol lysyltransferase